MTRPVSCWEGLGGSSLGQVVLVLLTAQLSSCWWDALQRWDGRHSPEMGVTSSRQVFQPRRWCHSPQMGVTAPEMGVGRVVSFPLGFLLSFSYRMVSPHPWTLSPSTTSSSSSSAPFPHPPPALIPSSMVCLILGSASSRMEELRNNP